MLVLFVIIGEVISVPSAWDSNCLSVQETMAIPSVCCCCWPGSCWGVETAATHPELNFCRVVVGGRIATLRASCSSRPQAGLMHKINYTIVYTVFHPSHRATLCLPHQAGHPETTGWPTVHTR